MREGWKSVELGSFMEFKNGLNADKDAYGSGVKFVNVMDIFRSSELYAGDIIGSVQTSPKAAAVYSVKHGDILFNRTSETPEDIACASVYLDSEPVTFGGFVIRGRQTKNLLDPEFCRYVFQANDVRRETVRRCQGAVRANIGQQDLAKVALNIPPPPEQRKIAAILRTWDEAIQHYTALRDAKAAQLAGIAEKLFSGKAMRDSKEINLGEVLIASKKQEPPSLDEVSLLTVKLHCKGADRNDSVRPKKTKNGRPYFVRRSGEIVIGRQNFHNGGIAIVPPELDGLVASNAISSFETSGEDAILEYIYFYISRRNFYRRAEVFMGGTGQKEISEREFLKLKIHLPSLDKQRQIVQFLTAAREEIELSHRQAEHVSQQKRGLMQKLLTGEWRVKVAADEEAAA